jgi:hypothetical protein
MAQPCCAGKPGHPCARIVEELNRHLVCEAWWRVLARRRGALRTALDDDPCAPICTPCAGGASSHGMWGRSTWKRSRRLRERVPSFALYSRQRTSCAHSQSVGYPWLPAFDSARGDPDRVNRRPLTSAGSCVMWAIRRTHQSSADPHLSQVAPRSRRPRMPGPLSRRRRTDASSPKSSLFSGGSA